MKKISIIVPIYNEEESLPFQRNRLLNTINKIKNYEFQVLLVNDGSKDNSLAEMREICKQDLRFKYISLSRNYGKEVAMLAGLDYCNFHRCRFTRSTRINWKNDRRMGKRLWWCICKKN